MRSGHHSSNSSNPTPEKFLPCAERTFTGMNHLMFHNEPQKPEVGSLKIFSSNNEPGRPQS
jgi:hypothetical protein